MELITKAAIIGIAGALVSLLLRKTNPELSLLLTLSVGVVIVAVALELAGNVLDVVELAAEMSGLSSAVLTPVLKCVGIGIVSKLASDVCRDAGQGSIASSVELAGSICALYAALPLIRTLLQMIGEIL